MDDFVFSVKSKEKFEELKRALKRLFRSFNMSLKHAISNSNNNLKVVNQIEEGKKEGSLEPGMEVPLGLKWFLEDDTILSNSYINQHPKK